MTSAWARYLVSRRRIQSFPNRSILRSFASHSFGTGVMNVSSDASNKGENDEYTGNGDRDHDPEEGEEQESGKGDEACESEEGDESAQGEEHPVRQQGREGPGSDATQGRSHPRGDRKGDGLAES